jgi:Tfp pilus assembly protein PilF
LPAYDLQKSIRLVAPLLYDPTRAVRIEAANYLTAFHEHPMDENLRKKYQVELNDYLQVMAYTADFAASRHNLGILYTNLGQLDKAVKNYEKSIHIDDQFYPAKVNLAMLYNQKGQNQAAAKLLREVAADNPDFHDIGYSLGLLLAEQKNYTEAAEYLQKAAEGLPQRARIHYNLGQLLAFLQKDRQAEEALSRALQLEPGNMDYLSAMADFYVRRNNYEKAEWIAEQMIERHPTSRAGHELRTFLNTRRKQLD